MVTISPQVNTLNLVSQIPFSSCELAFYAPLERGTRQAVELVVTGATDLIVKLKSDLLSNIGSDVSLETTEARMFASNCLKSQLLPI